MTRILALLVVAIPPAVSAATYFVATNGVDGNAGTEAQPWKSLRKASASVQPGDTVRIRAGEYFVVPTRIFGNLFEGDGKRSGISLNSVSNRVWSNTFVGSVKPFEYYPDKPGNMVTNNVVR